MPKNYTKETLAKALEEIKKGGMSVYKISKLYKIPRQTLSDKLLNKYTKQETAGAPPVLTSTEESLIVEWVQHLTEIGFPVTKQQLLHSVSNLVKKYKRPHKFKNGLPGKQWYKGFLRRNPAINERISELWTNPHSSHIVVDENNLRAWFQRVYNYIENKSLIDIFHDPSRIFNCDESVFFICSRGTGKVKKGFYRPRDKENDRVSLSIGSSADGTLVPIFALYPSKRKLSKYPENWIIGKSEYGWMTCQTFYDYITTVFYPFLIVEKVKLPVILFIDGHSSHLSLPLSEFCRENGIILIALLPNASHLLQPLEVPIFYNIKNAWIKEINRWKNENFGPVKLGQFVVILEDCISSTLIPDVIIDSFRTCGLCPFDSNALDYNKLPNSYNLNYSEPSSDPLALTTPNRNVEEFLEYFEEQLGNQKLITFKQCNGIWRGDIRDENLYYYWKKIKSKLEEDNSVRNTSEFRIKSYAETLSNIAIDWIEFNDIAIKQDQEDSDSS